MMTSFCTGCIMTVTANFKLDGYVLGVCADNIAIELKYD